MIDQAIIKVKAGNGGSGLVSFLREKYRPKGGPDGGNGGRGGDVFLVADENVATLRDFTARPLFGAENGGRGGTNTKAGRSGEDLFIKVPVGTLVREVPAGKTFRVKRSKFKGSVNMGGILFDLTKHGQTVLVGSGGDGGRGNHALRSSGNRLPREAELGRAGEGQQLFLELKLLADVGIIGLPNAGKTTLLNVLTRARGEVGSYPFTTLEPNLGVLEIGGRSVASPTSRSGLIIADIPGLIEGASMGRGLGDQFLKHVERTRILVHLLDGGRGSEDGSPALGDTKALWQDYQVINKELRSFHPMLVEKEQIVVLNKLDLTEVKEAYLKVQEFFNSRGVELLGVSAVTGEGLAELKERIFKRAASASAGTSELPNSRPRSVKTYRIKDLPNRRIVFEKAQMRSGLPPRGFSRRGV